MELERKNLICTGIDDNYLWPWMVSMFSAKKHASGEFSVKLGYIKGSLSVSNIELIQLFCAEFQISIEVREFNFDYYVQVSHIPIQTYIRVLWLDTLGDPFLWLDADTLLLENWQDVFENFDANNPEMIIKAALDADIIKNRLALFPNNSAYRRGGQTYFNAGVFMASPKNWKAKKFNLKWPEIASHFEELGFEHDDQDVLNYMTFENREILDSNFNSLVMQGSNIGDRILHFTGQPKPWHFDDGAKSYFTSIEVLKSKIGNGAFGGVNWLFEYQNYWRHEIALLESTVPGTQLRVNLQNLFLNSRRDLMARNDKIKYKLLLMTGRKWLKS